MTFDTVHDLLVYQLRDLYSAEVQLQQAMPFVVKTASDARLTGALEWHRQISDRHPYRIEQCCRTLDVSPRGVCCQGMEGLLKQLMARLRHRMSDELRDVALIADCRRIEQMEIAMYANTLAIVAEMREGEMARMLDRNMAEDESMALLLGHLSQHLVIPKSASTICLADLANHPPVVDAAAPMHAEHRASRF